MPISRITARFAKTAQDDRAALVAYLMGGDPDLETSYKALEAVRDNGADIIELGAPFTDPMADGPAIQMAGQRALAEGTKLSDVLGLAARLRETDQETPLILMGYANPLHKMGYEAFASAAADAGIDGVITVDLPPEEDAALRDALGEYEIAVIRLATPTTDDRRMKAVAEGAGGFVYYVSVAGVTGAGTGDAGDIKAGVERARAASGLPVAVGFGVRTPEQAAAFSRLADGVVVGSAIVDQARLAVDAGEPQTTPTRMGALVQTLASAISSAR